MTESNNRSTMGSNPKPSFEVVTFGVPPFQSSLVTLSTNLSSTSVSIASMGFELVGISSMTLVIARADSDNSPTSIAIIM